MTSTDADNQRDPLAGHGNGIILAADVDSLEKLATLVGALTDVDELVAVKVGFSLALRYGLPTVVRAIREVSNYPVIYDHQKAGTDVPQTASLFADACADAGIDAVIFFPHAGPMTLRSYVSAAKQRELVPIVGLVMTHPSYLDSEGGYIVDRAPEAIAQESISAGVTNFVLPGTKPEVISAFCTSPLRDVKNAVVMMPGIGSQGGSLKSAFAAARPHRPFAIIGSAIYAADDPCESLYRFASELQSCPI